MGRRFAVVIGVAALGVIALGAQTVLAGGDRAPDLKLGGKKTQGAPLPPKWSSQRRGPPGPRIVAVSASCGEFIGPPASPTDLTPTEASQLGESPPANLPDLGCHLSAKGKVTTVKNGTLKPGLQAHVDLPGPGLGCYAVNHDPSVLRCHWASGGGALMELKLGKKTLKQVRSALDDGKKVLAEVTVRAKFDASGKVETATRTIRLVKYLK